MSPMSSPKVEKQMDGCSSMSVRLPGSQPAVGRAVKMAVGRAVKMAVGVSLFHRQRGAASSSCWRRPRRPCSCKSSPGRKGGVSEKKRLFERLPVVSPFKAVFQRRHCFRTRKKLPPFVTCPIPKYSARTPELCSTELSSHLQHQRDDQPLSNPPACHLFGRADAPGVAVPSGIFLKYLRGVHGVVQRLPRPDAE